MKLKIRLSAVLALCVVLLLSTLTAMAQVQRRPRRSAAIGAGGAGLYGVKSKTRKQVVEREQLEITSGGNGQSGLRRRTKSQSPTKTSKPVVTTNAGQSQNSSNTPNQVSGNSTWTGPVGQNATTTPQDRTDNAADYVVQKPKPKQTTGVTRVRTRSRRPTVVGSNSRNP